MTWTTSIVSFVTTSLLYEMTFFNHWIGFAHSTLFDEKIVDNHYFEENEDENSDDEAYEDDNYDPEVPEDAYDLQLALALSLSAAPPEVDLTREVNSHPSSRPQDEGNTTQEADDISDIATSDCVSAIDREVEDEDEEWTNIESFAPSPERPTYAQMTKIEIR